MKIIFVRHGETDWNLKKRYSGFLDVELNKTGKLQAKLLEKRLQYEKIDKIYSSDRKRAIQTAQIIFKKIKIEKIPDLREIHFGIFEGLTHKEIIQRYPLVYKKWLKDPYSLTIPKGEHLLKFRQRIVKILNKILKLNKNKTIAVITHGGVISIYLNHLLKSKKFWQHLPHSASISILEYKNNKPKIRLFDGTDHLK